MPGPVGVDGERGRRPPVGQPHMGCEGRDDADDTHIIEEEDFVAISCEEDYFDEQAIASFDYGFFS